MNNNGDGEARDAGTNVNTDVGVNINVDGMYGCYVMCGRRRLWLPLDYEDGDDDDEDDGKEDDIEREIKNNVTLYKHMPTNSSPASLNLTQGGYVCLLISISYMVLKL